MGDAQERGRLGHAPTLSEIGFESEMWHPAVVKRWLEIAVTVPAEAADAVANRLVEIGAPGTIEEDSPDGRRVVRAHFRESLDRGALVDELRAWLSAVEDSFPGCASAPLRVEAIAEEDWAEGWKQGFPPIEVGRRLRIRPPWCPPATGDRLEVEIEPAMAFGTGQHATTFGCLLALEELFERTGPLSPVLDVGTGSGILAMAAARLGATEVVAIDNDPVAVAAARENVRRNRLERSVGVVEGTADGLPGTFALIVANLYSGALGSLAPTFASLAAPAGWLVVSGLLGVDCAAVVAAMERSGWRQGAAESRDGWMTLVFGRAS